MHPGILPHPIRTCRFRTCAWSWSTSPPPRPPSSSRRLARASRPPSHRRYTPWFPFPDPPGIHRLFLAAPLAISSRLIPQPTRSAAQHILMNRNHLLVGGVRPHHYCLPILKRERHRERVLEAAVSGSPKFFLGTDSGTLPRRRNDFNIFHIVQYVCRIRLHVHVRTPRPTAVTPPPTAVPPPPSARRSAASAWGQGIGVWVRGVLHGPARPWPLRRGLRPRQRARQGTGTHSGEKIREQSRGTESGDNGGGQSRGIWRGGCFGARSSSIRVRICASRSRPCARRALTDLPRSSQLEAFASFHGPDFYGLPRNVDTVTLVRKASPIPNEYAFGSATVVPLWAGQALQWSVE